MQFDFIEGCCVTVTSGAVCVTAVGESKWLVAVQQLLVAKNYQLC